ncbi:hypothetical protein WDW89_04180 [Deltaproteobacteria bacterium TL4]
MAPDATEGSNLPNHADLLAELLGSSGDPIPAPSQKSEKTSSSNAYITTVFFQLVMPGWNTGRLTRSLHVAFKTIEDACHQADEWVDQTHKLIKDLIDSLPDVWPDHDSGEVTSRLLGQFYAISQQYPVSQYLSNFSQIPKIANTFPKGMEVGVPSNLLQEGLESAPWWGMAWIAYQKSEQSLRQLGGSEEKLKANVPLRKIGIYWLKLQNALQMRGTLRDAGDYYFVFLKSVQRLFNISPGDQVKYLWDEMLSDVKELADHLKSTHRSHLMYLFNGFEQTLRNSLLPWQAEKFMRISRLQKYVEKVEQENVERLEKYSKALEYALEDFHIRLQFFKIQREALRIMQGELSFIRQQYKRLDKQLIDSIEKIRSVVPESVDEWENLNKFKFSFRMNQVQKNCFSAILQLQNVFRQILSNTRTNNMVDLVLRRYEAISQTLPEHANIVHLDKLWSWTNKKVEIDEAVPLRYTVERFFHTKLDEDLNFYHSRWLNYIRIWSDLVAQQEQFFHFSFYSLRQEYGDPATDWQNANRAVLHKTLIDSSQPTIGQLSSIEQDLTKEYEIFDSQTQKAVTTTISALEEVIFDPGLREKLLRLATEGTGTLSTIIRFVIELKHIEIILRLPLIRHVLFSYRWLDKKTMEWSKKFEKKKQAPEALSPAYYSRIFVIEPLEVASLFVERTQEIEQMHRIWEQRLQRERTVLAIIGKPGSGKRSLIHHFLHNEISGSMMNVRLSLLDEQISAMINNQPFSLDRMLHKVLVDRFEVIVLEGLEACFVESVGGATFLKEFFNWLQNASGRIFWIISINELSWKTMGLLEQVGATFTDVVQISPTSGKDLEQMLIKRHNVVGLPVKFKVPEKKSYQLLSQFKPEECQKLLNWRFFSELALRSEGLPALALRLWIQQVRVFNDNEIYILPFKEDTELPLLGEEELLILRIVLAQGPVSAHHLQPAVMSSKYLRVCLDKLSGLGLISIQKFNASTLFLANPNSYRTIYQLLRKAMLLS